MTNIKVAVRVRPLALSIRERSSGASGKHVVSTDSNNVVSVTNIKVPENHAGDSRERVRLFAFDFCFDQDSSQTQVFDTLGHDVLRSVAQKYNVCVLAYGQSATGKTYTMMGSENDPGLTPRICRGLFAELAKDRSLKFHLTVSFLEIYNERVQDLLGPNGKPGASLKVREHPKQGPYVQGLTEHNVDDAEGLLEWVRRGEGARSVAETLSNRSSSRSHSVLTVSCRQIQDGTDSTSQVHLVDLAGSERASSVQNSLCRLQEGANINRSLVALGNVITALAEHNFGKQGQRFVPYRDSVLTWLLKDTLGGNSNTIMIATVSPSSHCYSETVNTLRFGQRAKQIVNVPIINENPTTRLIRELRSEIARLHQLLSAQQPLTMEVSTSKDVTITEIPPNKLEQLAESETSIESQSNQIVSNEKIFPIIKVEAYKPPKSSYTNLRRTCSVFELRQQSKKIPRYGSQESLGRRTFPAPTLISHGDQHSQRISTESLTEEYSAATSLLAQGRNFSASASFAADDIIRQHSRSIGTETGCNSPASYVFMVNGETQTEETTSPSKSIKEAIKKHSIHKRNEIVASVTDRLYAKGKRKSEQPDHPTRSSSSSLTSELSLGANARSRLQDISFRALNASRRSKKPVTVETQTDFVHTVRVKDVATDIPHDMNAALCRTKDAAVETIFSGVHIAVGPDSTLTLDKTMETTQPAFKLTRSCGNVTEDSDVILPKPVVAKNKLISFTKYIMHTTQTLEPENISFSIPNFDPEIYTTSVNINFNLTDPSAEDCISDDSLDNHPLIASRTPDLLNNHNSLENTLQHPKDSKKRERSSSLVPPILPKPILHAIELCGIEFFERVLAHSSTIWTCAKARPVVEVTTRCSISVTEVLTHRIDYSQAEVNFEHVSEERLRTIPNRPSKVPVIEIDPPAMAPDQASDVEDFPDDESVILPRSSGLETESVEHIRSLISGHSKNVFPFNIDLEEFYRKDTNTEPASRCSLKHVSWVDEHDRNQHLCTAPPVGSSEVADRASRKILNSVSGFLDEATCLISNLNAATTRCQGVSRFSTDPQICLNFRACEICAPQRCSFSEADSRLYGPEEFGVTANKCEEPLLAACGRLAECLEREDVSPCDYRGFAMRNYRGIRPSLYRPRKLTSPSAYLRELQETRKQVIEDSRKNVRRLSQM